MKALPQLASAAFTSWLVGALCACSSAPTSTASFTGSRTVGVGAADDLDLETEIGSPAFLASAVSAAAQQSDEPAPNANYPNMYRRAGLSAGAALYGNFDTAIRVDGDQGVGATLDMEDLLGLDDDNLIARFDAFYAFSPRHRVDLGVYDIRRNGTRVLEDDIQVGEVVIPSGEVHTALDTLIVKAAYRYNFVADTRTAIGASFGLHTMGIDFGIESTEFDVSEGFGVTVPLPVFGLHGEYALGERWKLLASAEFFQIDLGFAQGFLGDNRLALENDLFDHVGWGVAFSGFQLDAEVEDENLNADLEYAYQGLLLYLRCYL